MALLQTVFIPNTSRSQIRWHLLKCCLFFCLVEAMKGELGDMRRKMVAGRGAMLASGLW